MIVPTINEKGYKIYYCHEIKISLNVEMFVESIFNNEKEAEECANELEKRCINVMVKQIEIPDSLHPDNELIVNSKRVINTLKEWIKRDDNYNESESDSDSD